MFSCQSCHVLIKLEIFLNPQIPNFVKSRPLVAELFYAGRLTEGQTNVKKEQLLFEIFGTRLEITKHWNNTIFWDMMLFSVIEICLDFGVPSLRVQGKQVVQVVLEYIASHLRGIYPVFTTTKTTNFTNNQQFQVHLTFSVQESWGDISSSNMSIKVLDLLATDRLV